jgi:hypothetical protein
MADKLPGRIGDFLRHRPPWYLAVRVGVPALEGLDNAFKPWKATTPA